MQIPLIYILISSELLAITLVAVGIIIYIKRKRKPAGKPLPDETTEETPVVHGGNSYIQFLEKEISDNQGKIRQQSNIENHPDNEKAAGEEADDKAANSALLEMREMFLQLEKEAASERENDIRFWDTLLQGLKTIGKNLRTSESHIVEQEHDAVKHKVEVKEQVFYIETQGKKIDSEVNKLKDIIYEQENSINGLRKAMNHIGEQQPENSEAIDALQQQLDTLERQLSDSKMCMDVLEMENERLQLELESAQKQLNDQVAAKPQSSIDLEEMQELIDKQEHQIEDLNHSIDELQLEASQTDKLRTAMSDFTRSSKEMMNCITILEEENLRMKQTLDQQDGDQPEGDNEETEALNQQVSSLEEELIKKDVAFAKLQEQYADLEKQFLALPQEDEHQ